MKNNRHSIIIKVDNLDLCRSFYRDILELGNPVMDSNFWVEFKLNDKLSLVLERNEGEESLGARTGRICWMLQAGKKFPELLQRLKRHGFIPKEDKSEKVGYEVRSFQDPEGNDIYISSQSNSR